MAQRSSPGSALAARDACWTSAPSAFANRSVSACSRSEPPVEACHPQREDLVGLLAADPGGLAGLLAHRHPGADILTERPFGVAPRAPREALSGREEGGPERPFSRRVPDAAQTALHSLTGRGVGAGLKVHASAHQGRHPDGRRAHEPQSLLRPRIPAELREERVHRRIASLRRETQAAKHHPPKPGGDPSVSRGFGQLPTLRVVPGQLAGEGPRTVERLVQRHAEAELVRTGIGGLSIEKLRRQVRRRAEDHPRLGEWRGERDPLVGGRSDLVSRLEVIGLPLASDPEVEDADLTVRADEHVLGLAVAVDQTGSVRRRQASTCCKEDRRHLPPRPRLLLQPGTERAPFDQLHGHEHTLTVSADVVDMHDVRVRQAGQRLRFSNEPLLSTGALRSGRAGLEQLDRHPAVKLRVIGGVHHAHSTLADLVEDDVAPEAGATRQRGVGRQRPVPAGSVLFGLSRRRTDHTRRVLLRVSESGSALRARHGVRPHLRSIARGKPPLRASPERRFVGTGRAPLRFRHPSSPLSVAGIVPYKGRNEEEHPTSGLRVRVR